MASARAGAPARRIRTSGARHRAAFSTRRWRSRRAHGLAGYGREEYERLDSRSQRAARVEIDRELALRRELSETARAVVPEADAQRPGRRARRKAARSFDDAVQ